MAALLLLTACAGVAPLGRLVGAALADATGVAFGPDGIGWWLAVSTTAFLAVSLWAVVPLHERLATATWLGLALVAWGGAAAGTWLAAGHERAEVAGLAAWSLGAAFALIAMLAATGSAEWLAECPPRTVLTPARLCSRAL
jgi:tellurite resistance protein TehA-like permease